MWRKVINLLIRLNNTYINHIISLIISSFLFNKWNISRRLHNTTLFWFNFTKLWLHISKWSLCIYHFILFRQTLINLIPWISSFFNLIKIIINNFEFKFFKKNCKKSRFYFHLDSIDVIFMLQNTILLEMNSISCQWSIVRIQLSSYGRNQIFINFD